MFLQKKFTGVIAGGMVNPDFMTTKNCDMFLVLLKYARVNIKINSICQARGLKKGLKKYFDEGMQDRFWRKNFFFSLSIYSHI